MRILGITLIGIGILAFLYTGFSFTTKKKVVDIGPIDINKKEKHSVAWPPILGAILIVVGGVVLVMDKSKK